MFVGGQAECPHFGQQLGDAGVPGQVDPQHQGVDEEAPPVVERGVGRPAIGKPTATSVLALVLDNSTARATCNTMKPSLVPKKPPGDGPLSSAGRSTGYVAPR